MSEMGETGETGEMGEVLGEAPSGTPFPERPRSETMDIVMTVVSSLNDVITTLRAEILAFTGTEKRRRELLDVKLALLGIAVVVSMVGVGLSLRQGQSIKKVVHYIEDCQKPDSECKKRNDDVIGRAVQSISGSVFDANACVQSVPLDQRTEAKVKACRDKYIGTTKR